MSEHSDVLDRLTGRGERSPFSISLGQRMREVRVSAGLSLARAERLSAGRLKAVTIASYERADRAISAERLAAVAEFYHVSPGWLLTGESDTEGVLIPAEATS